MVAVLGVVLGACAATSEVSAPEVEKVNVQTYEYEITIAAPVETVWETMFDPESYTKWTAAFFEGSYFEGTWEQGEPMYFLAPGGDGMVSEIAENRPHEVMSIRHLGYVVDGVEDTTSESVRTWAPSYETYRFESVPGGTKVTIHQDSMAGYEAVMDSVWPRALAALESLCLEE